MRFKLTDGLGCEIPENELHVPYYGENCQTCGSQAHLQWVFTVR